MAKSVHNDVLDGALTVIRTNATLEILCSAEPTTRTEAVATYALADVSVSSSDFTISDGDTNGRKIRVAAKSSVPVDANGTGNHIAVVDGTRLLFVTTCTSQVVTAGNTCNIPAYDYELADPT